MILRPIGDCRRVVNIHGLEVRTFLLRRIHDFIVCFDRRATSARRPKPVRRSTMNDMTISIPSDEPQPMRVPYNPFYLLSAIFMLVGLKIALSR